MSNEDSSSHTKPEIGRMLERARTERGLSLWQVEEATKIRARYLHDLERENFDVLPAVYVLGSLKTYADYLGLDGEALALELKSRQAPAQEEQDPADEEPANVGRGGLLASLAGLAGPPGSPDAAGDAAPATVAGHGPRLYLGLGAGLIIILAVALVSILGGDGQPAVSQVREPQISEAPSRIAFSGDARDGRDAGRNQDTERADDRSEKRAKSPDKGDEKEEKNGAENGDQEEQDRAEDVVDLAITQPTPSTASASTASASAASANASATAPAASVPAATTPASTVPASAPPAATAPASTAPATASATAAPEAADPGTAPTPLAVEPAPTAVGPAPAGVPVGSGSGRTQGGGLDASRLADGIFSRVRSATNSAR